MFSIPLITGFNLDENISIDNASNNYEYFLCCIIGNNYCGNIYRGKYYRGKYYHGKYYRGKYYRGKYYRGKYYRGKYYRGKYYHGKYYRGKYYHGKFYRCQYNNGKVIAGNVAGASRQQVMFSTVRLVVVLIFLSSKLYSYL